MSHAARPHCSAIPASTADSSSRVSGYGQPGFYESHFLRHGGEVDLTHRVTAVDVIRRLYAQWTRCFAGQISQNSRHNPNISKHS